MTIYTTSQYEWQDYEQIGDNFRSFSWLLLQRRDQFGAMFTRDVLKNNKFTKQWSVLKSRSYYVDDDSDSE